MAIAFKNLLLAVQLVNLEAQMLRRYVLEALRITTSTIGTLPKAWKDVTAEDAIGVRLIRKVETIAISHICSN